VRKGPDFDLGGVLSSGEQSGFFAGPDYSSESFHCRPGSAASLKAVEQRRISARVRLSSPNAAADRSRRGVAAVERRRVHPESELFEPTLQRRTMDTNEVPTIAADHREDPGSYEGRSLNALSLQPTATGGSSSISTRFSQPLRTRSDSSRLMRGTDVPGKSANCVAVRNG
jgi:hypothetical protein